MIQNLPVCFGCEARIDDPLQIVFAPPFTDDHRDISATFHGVCLMGWRERRNVVVEKMRAARAAFFKHLEGECGCD